jgi:rSAM/selenodomain-associated transferase 2
MTISVVIPTLNESATIARLLTVLQKMDSALELIVADCGSADNTQTIAGAYATVVQAKRGRSAQMNAGAKLSSGEILWFLHADCIPHSDSIKQIENALSNSLIIGGAFELALEDRRHIYRVIEYFSNKKHKVLNQFFGDMGIFVRRKTFFKVKGFAEIPLMEDMDLCKRLKKKGNIVLLPARITTSTRRWQEEGIIKNIILNWLLQIAWTIGVSPERLSKFYHFK